MNAEDNGPSPDTPAALPDELKPAEAVSASSLARTVRATIPSRARKYDTSQVVEELYREHAFLLKQGENGLHEKVALEIYAIYRPRIIKIARKYSSLSPIFGEDDLRQEALIAILQALRKYRHSPDIRMKFSTYLEWSIRNIFQRAIGHRDKYVEVYDRDGAFVKTMGYGKFVEQKKTLEAAGCTYTTKKRFCYLSEFLREEDLEARLNEASVAPYEYQALQGSSERPVEGEKTGADKEAAEEPGPGIPGNGSDPRNGLDFQMIDGLYRQWAKFSRQSGITENDPLVLRIYDLSREYGERMLQPFRNNGTTIDMEEARRSILSAIRQRLLRHDNDSFPPVPFSVSLRVSITRSLHSLIKAHCRAKEGSHG